MLYYKSWGILDLKQHRPKSLKYRQINSLCSVMRSCKIKFTRLKNLNHNFGRLADWALSSAFRKSSAKACNLTLSKKDRLSWYTRFKGYGVGLSLLVGCKWNRGGPKLPFMAQPRTRDTRCSFSAPLNIKMLLHLAPQKTLCRGETCFSIWSIYPAEMLFPARPSFELSDKYFKEAKEGEYKSVSVRGINARKKILAGHGSIYFNVLIQFKCLFKCVSW